MRRHPHLYEINALVWLRRLSARHDRPLSLGTVPDEEWQALARRGFDLIWLMGVWRRSPFARSLALSHPNLRRAYDQLLPGWKPEDVCGSPYAVHGYTLDPALGAEEELPEVRSRLHRLGVGLVLDFVPNHLALDHPWTASHPQRFVGASEGALRAHPEWLFVTPAGRRLAHGRDPNFFPWTDTVQVNFFSREMREALIEELRRIARSSDGVRCDMAMLGLNAVFDRTWGDVLRGSGPARAAAAAAAPPATEFWAEAVRAVRGDCPQFLFLAEVYWGLEGELARLGFDYAYDKDLYDRLRHGSAADVAARLRAVPGADGGSARFIENHDEERAIVAFGPERSRAAAVVLATAPGMRFFHDGQTEGKRIHLPVQLGREPAEAPDAATAAFYERLLAVANGRVLHQAEWIPLSPAPAWEGSGSHGSLLAWCWRDASEMVVVVVNYADHPAQARIRVPALPGHGNPVVFRDELAGRTYIRDAGELQGPGLYVDLGPWQSHLLVAVD